MSVSRLRVFAALGAGVVVVSFASIIIRVTPAPSIVIAAGRLAVATLVLTPIYWARFPVRRAELKGIPFLPVLVSGVLLAAHFALWPPTSEPNLAVRASLELGSLLVSLMSSCSSSAIGIATGIRAAARSVSR